MREKLIQYVELLFAGIPDCEDMKQEILQNTLDRYDDLIAQGKVPEAAYRLAIGGIGDLSELLKDTPPEESPAPAPVPSPETEPETNAKKRFRAIAIGLYIVSAIPLILGGEMGNGTVGLCLTLLIVAVATVILIVCGKKDKEEPEEKEPEETGKSPLARSISSLLWTVGLLAYLLVSFATGAWHVTWVFFPVLGALDHCLGIWADGRDSALPAPEQKKSLRKAMGGILWAACVAVYFLVSFGTGAWFLTWILFPLTGAVQGLVGAILDLKEAVTHEN